MYIRRITDTLSVAWLAYFAIRFHFQAFIHTSLHCLVACEFWRKWIFNAFTSVWLLMGSSRAETDDLENGFCTCQSWMTFCRRFVNMFWWKSIFELIRTLDLSENSQLQTVLRSWNTVEDEVEELYYSTSIYHGFWLLKRSSKDIVDIE